MARPKSPVRPEWVDPAVCSLEYRMKIIGRLSFFKHLPIDAISKINDLFQLPFSRQDLAELTGSTTETVSRVMSRFGEVGVVKSGRKWVDHLGYVALGRTGKKSAVN